MFDFDGYAFIGAGEESVIVVSDRITKENLIEWGWCTKYKRATDVLIRDLKSGWAFEYIKDGKYSYYHLEPSLSGTGSPYFKTYWISSGVVDSNIVDLINLMQGAPISDVRNEVADSYFITEDGRRFTTNIYMFPVDRIPFNFVMKNTPIPGVDFQNGVEDEGFQNGLYPFPDDYILSKYGQEVYGLWMGGAYGGERYRAHNYLGPYRRYTVLFNNCEVTPLCVEFVYSITSDGPIANSPKGHFTSASLKPISLFIPKVVRRLPMVRYQPRTSTGSISCYVMNRAMVKSLTDDLYTTDVYEKINKMLYGDGAGNILSLKWFYGVRSSVVTTKQAKVTLGNVTLDKLVSHIYNGDFVQVYMGYVTVPREYGDYRDFTNVRYQAFIPMVGDIDLDPSQVVGKDLHLLYTVNLTDGSAVVTLSISNLKQNNLPALPKNDGWYETPQIVFTTSITYGYEIPLNVESIRSASTMIGEIAVKAVASGAAGVVAGGLAGAAVGAVSGAAVGAVASAGVESTYSSGSLSPNSNVMGDFSPKLTRTITKDVSGDISQAVGFPCGKVVRVGDAGGYLKAAMVYGTPSSTMQHTDEIINLLKEGIYIS